MRLHRLAAAALTLACAGYPVRPPQPPTDPKERLRAEIAACSNAKLPRWLDDDALASAIALDGREGQASAVNESFHGAAYASQPPPARGGGAHTAAVFEERRAFERWCAGLKARSPGGDGHGGDLGQHDR